MLLNGNKRVRKRSKICSWQQFLNKCHLHQSQAVLNNKHVDFEIVIKKSPIFVVRQVSNYQKVAFVC